MRTKHIWLVGVIGLCLIGGLAAWQLRSPIQAGAQYLRQTLAKPELRFVVVGDNHGDNPIYRQILDEVKGERYDFVLNLGDNSEYGTPTEFASDVTLESQLPFPVYHTVGNHDIKSDPSRQAFQTAFHQDANTVLAFGNTRLVILDNADRKVGFSTATLDWLKAQLDQDPSAQWMIAYHRPFDLPLASLAGDDETATSRASNDRLMKLLSGHSVIQIFTAHLHTYIPYSVHDIPAVVTGGGGDPAQAVLGGPKNNLFHYLEVTIRRGHPTITVHRVQLGHNEAR